MDWLLSSFPSWSRATIPDVTKSETKQGQSSKSAALEDDIDAPPPFPMLNSHQRSIISSSSPTSASSGENLSKKGPVPALSFAVAPPSPTSSVKDNEPSDLNIAIIPDNIPIGDMAPPPSTVKKPAFGLQTGGKDTETRGEMKRKRKGKVALTPGHSPLDWAKLTSSGQDLRGVTSFQRVTLAELKEHNTRNDAWSAFNGMVYNITPYLPFHPGGEDELMRVAGRDGTRLFMLTHSWVNMDYMLKECMVGVLITS
ncbi:uncharacterized protein L203_101577 [Cryptococcus depauperatus CBS 7841]|uniref:Uncharacterized protein n=1 Tax=Cryptococcus depauperatus CBS 7841 TaxID=1295531 RepID=A0A1E3IV79_9TREE|nr:cytoplasmic protein [Cryptococcus depauperatus CBS 7841]